jgi:riboflavin biosynthesis pyrimidine reductase
VAVLVAKNTPREYIDYLQARHYDFFASGEEQVDLPQALAWMVDCFGIRTVMTDAGSGLTNALLNQGLVDQISLLTLPTVVGRAAQNLFQQVTNPVKLSLVTSKAYPGGYIWSLYQVEDRPQQ